MEENKCRICGRQSQGFKICDDCYSRWNEDRATCQICEQKRTGSKIGLCSTCKNPFIEEVMIFLKSKIAYWDLIKNKTRENILNKEKMTTDPRELKCPTENCKTKFLTNSFNAKNIIICPVCGNKMR